jgi:hypothetical protein
MATTLYHQAVTTSWAPLPNVRATKVSILNNTGAGILVSETTQTGDAARSVTLADGQPMALTPQERATEFSIKAAAGADGVQLVIETF